MLDMDGTLLDRHFDDYFWEHFVPEVYARNNRLTGDEARQRLLKKYQAREGTLAWTDLDFWSDELGLDIPALKIQVDHLIAVHPCVLVFLEYCREQGKTIWLVTNAHSKTLEIKMAKTALQDRFDRLICAEEVGVAKEDVRFWKRLQGLHDYNPSRTLLVDDTEKVLASAAVGGIENLIHLARPSSRAAVRPSQRFASIVYFQELIPTLMTRC
ncbi:MAG: HAD-IA family hydrolase [Desulfobulbaceae bacterium]|nr:HAD-IA family hydrolase [Desulfobulbaceae bacterium]